MSSQSCDAGEAGTGTNGVCEACAVGQFRKAGTDANSCIGCIVGRYQSEKGQASCLPCIPGSFMDITGATKCKKCNENFKSETPGSTKCLACGTGKRSSNGSAVCQDCQPGEAGTPCSKCEPGKYRGETDETTACKTCTIGQSSTKGSSSCTKCDLGRYGSSSNPGVCAECIDKKEYQDTKGQTKCLSCKLGEKWISLISSCTKCTFGQYGSENGTCVNCNAGRFQDEPGKHECKDCSVDTYLSEEGRSSKAECKDCDSDKSTGTTIGSLFEMILLSLGLNILVGCLNMYSPTSSLSSSSSTSQNQLYDEIIYNDDDDLGGSQDQIIDFLKASQDQIIDFLKAAMAANMQNFLSIKSKIKDQNIVCFHLLKLREGDCFYYVEPREDLRHYSVKWLGINNIPVQNAFITAVDSWCEFNQESLVKFYIRNSLEDEEDQLAMVHQFISLAISKPTPTSPSAGSSENECSTSTRFLKFEVGEVEKIFKMKHGYNDMDTSGLEMILSLLALTLNKRKSESFITNPI